MLSAKRLRKNKKYYINELNQNSIRNEKKRYDDTRRKQIEISLKERIRMCGKYKYKKWSGKEIEYLKKYYKTKYIVNMAIKLKRSYISVCHKLWRLGLFYNHKWKKLRIKGD